MLRSTYGHVGIENAARNNVDPDDGNHWECSACRLPIFATPFTITVDPNGGNTLHMHDQCANQTPAEFESHPLHPRGDLILQQQDAADLNDNGNKYSCSRCHSLCGSKFYKCPFPNDCDFTLDLSCALSITIIHQSHTHGLTAIRGSSFSFICAVCGTQHQPPRRFKMDVRHKWGVSYMCGLCDFWIHPHCAVLPNAIIGEKYHPHPLLLTYAYIGPSEGVYYIYRDFSYNNYVCEICDGGMSEGLGWYRCFYCGYSAHVKCVIYSDHRDSFKQVLLRDAQIPGLLHLPMADERQSLMPHIMKTTSTATATATATATDGASTSTSTSINKMHKHPLIFQDPLRLHNHHNDDIGGEAAADDFADDRVCNGCVQLISPSDTFYSCSSSRDIKEQVSACGDFFLHSCCAHLPDTITVPYCYSDQDHTLCLVPKVDKYPFNIFSCRYEYSNIYSRYFSNWMQCNGFAYTCMPCKGDAYLDVVSALMPTSITHDAHAKSHILLRTNLGAGYCICCRMRIHTRHHLAYECNTCHNFLIHTECALFPDTVRHKFDRHPLKLITTAAPLGHDRQQEEEEPQTPLCEICEQNLDCRRWFYGCEECDHSFHIDCIPNFDHLSKIKFGFTVQVKCHDCPLACVRALSVDGYKCGHCEGVIRGSDKIAFECAECYFRIHKKCVEELLSQGC